MPWSKDNLPDSVKNKKWSDSQIETFVKTANTVLEKTKDEGEAIATGIKQAESEHQNANQYPKVFYCRHMQPGLCGYGEEKVLVDTEAMKRMINAEAVGKPVYVLHSEAPNEERLKNLQKEAAGYITDSFYNELDGWAWFKFLAVSDQGHQAIASGWKVSNAYIPTEWASGGTKNNVPYDREIKSGYFTHLAIVPDPRYEDAIIMTPEKFRSYQEAKRHELQELQNSQSKKGAPMLKFFKNKREEVSASAIDADTMVELEGGVVVSVREMQNAMKKNESEESEKKKKEEEEKKRKEEEEKKNFKEANAQEMENAMVECDGETMPLKELVNRFKAMKKNEKEAEEKKNAEAKAEEEKKKKEEEEKKNNEEYELENSRFKELQNANNNKAATAPIVLETSSDKVQRGKDRY